MKGSRSDRTSSTRDSRLLIPPVPAPRPDARIVVCAVCRIDPASLSVDGRRVCVDCIDDYMAYTAYPGDGQ